MSVVSVDGDDTQEQDCNPDPRHDPQVAGREPERDINDDASEDDVHEYRRGDLNGTYADLTSLSCEQQLTFDDTGNWTLDKKDANGDGTWDWDETRTHNKANEITLLGGSSAVIAHNLVLYGWLFLSNPLSRVWGNMEVLGYEICYDPVRSSAAAGLAH